MEQIPISQIWEWLADVPDPEIPAISLVDLGVIRDVEWESDVLNVAVSPTYTGCPATAVIELDIQTALQGHGVKNINLTQKISPAWTTDWMSEAGRAKLEKYGIAPPNSATGPQRCPNCKSGDIAKISQFGSTPCKALWRCQECREPFEYFKCI